MHPSQIAALRGLLDATLAECLRSPVATLNAGHLKAILVEHLLRTGARVLERGSSSREGRILRMTDDVVRVERHPAGDTAAARRARTGRVADLRIFGPVALGVELYARSALAGPDRTGPQVLRERLAALADGRADALLLACDRRVFDALRVERGQEGEGRVGEAEGDRPAALARACAALLPPSAALGEEPVEHAPRLNGVRYGALAAMTPMVFGAQKVVAVVWPALRPAGSIDEAAQMDAFEAMEG